MGWGATTNDEEFNSKQLEKIGARTDRPKALEMPYVGMPTCSKEYNRKYGNWSLIGSFWHRFSETTLVQMTTPTVMLLVA